MNTRCVISSLKFVDGRILVAISKFWLFPNLERK